MGKEHLGLKKGRWSPMWATTIAAVAAGIYFFLASILSGRDLKIFAVMWKNALSILLLPFSIGGFCLIILMPLAEEIYYRGFLYGFLRTKLEARSALVLQALLFAFFHFEFSVSVFLELFVGGIVLGVLYEVSNSIYPNVIFHCVMSWLIYAYRAGAVI
jgi:membrane protease YdiL (CAAX protease family)